MAHQVGRVGADALYMVRTSAWIDPYKTISLDGPL
jgi:hypothetical protein